MAKRLEVYKCEVCGNIIEVFDGGVGELVCCGEPMVLLEAKGTDEGKEKHVPVMEVNGDQVTVKVGSIPHPMEEKHHIEWIELVDEKCNRIQVKFLKAGDKPEAHFHVCPGCAEHVYAREHCNIHGLWKNS
ncbi:desulfoferrodoxin [bacterium]|nr:desulfoferrodoxin [bacterium]